MDQEKKLVIKCEYCGEIKGKRTFPSLVLDRKVFFYCSKKCMRKSTYQGEPIDLLDQKYGPSIVDQTILDENS